MYGGNTDLVAAICGENVPGDMATFTPQQRDDLEQLGFTPSDDGVTWQRRLPWPAMSRVIWDTVQASTLRLRDIGGIESPDQLTYKAWRYPSDSTKNANDIGDKKLHIPELRIPREQQ
ncbi:TY-Chap domain-containing protein [Arachnia propionica]|uniref:TY-Chap domain-containing protein n=1 Tax=Arachnia propionica TaxID=1750 RepID=UPI00399D1A0E